MTKVTTGLLLGLLLSPPAFAEDLMDVFGMALHSDPQLLAEAASREAIGELDDQALANFLPQVGLSANTTRNWSDVSGATRDSSDLNFNSHGYTLNLTQSLYNRQNFVQKEQADIAIDSADVSFFAAEQALIVRVAERYFAVLGAEDDLRFAKAEYEAIAEQLQQMQGRFDVGIATITDVTEAQAAYDLANAARIAAENALNDAHEQLRETAGEYLYDLDALQQEAPLVAPEPSNIDEWSQTALLQNPALQVASNNVEIARQEIEMQRSGHYPRLDIVAEKSYQSQNNSVLRGRNTNHDKAIGLEFTLPIYSGGAVSSRTREAGHRLNEMMQVEEQQRRLVTRQTRESYNGVLSGISRVKALQQAVASNQKALEATEAGFNVGTRTTVDVLNARRNLFSAHRDYARSRYDYILNTLRLKQAAGIVSVVDLEQINLWLAP